MTITNQAPELSPDASRRRFIRSRQERAADKAAAALRAAELQTALDELRRAEKEQRRRERETSRAARSEARPLEDKLTMVAATIATIVAGQGMWNFLDRVLGPQRDEAGQVLLNQAGELVNPGVPIWLRGLMFAFVEVAVITSAVRARRNMKDKHSAGIDGLAVWVLTSVSAVLAALEAHSLPEVLFRLAAPLIAAWLWERSMAIERARLTGKTRINWRWTPEKILVRLGLAEPTERTAGEVDAERRLTKAALAADHYEDLADGWRKRRALKALKRQGRAIIIHTDVATDPQQQAFLSAQISTARAIGRLAEAGGKAFWEDDTLAPALVSSERSTERISERDERGEASADFPENNPDPLAPALTETLAVNERDSEHYEDRDRPNEADNRTAEAWIRTKCRGKSGTGQRPAWREVRDRYGFSMGWAGDRIQAVQTRMIAQGYVFLEDGRVYAPGVALPEDDDQAGGSTLAPLSGLSEKQHIHHTNGAEVA